MKKLENYGLVESNAAEMSETTGGGWIADVVAWIAHDAKCGCGGLNAYHSAMSSSNYGGIR